MTIHFLFKFVKSAVNILRLKLLVILFIYMNIQNTMDTQAKPIRYKSFASLLGGVLTYSISYFYFGYSLGYFNSIHFPIIQHIFNIQMEEESAEGLFSGCLPFGALFGAFFSSKIIDKFSRRQSFFIIDGLAILATVLVMTDLASMLLIGRFLQGFSVGLFSALVPIMIKEYSPSQLSGSFGALLAPSIGCGFFIAYLMPYLLIKNHDPSTFWRYTFGFPILLIIIQIILLVKVYNHETPKYLISKGKIQQARNLISRIYHDQYVQQILNQKMIDNKDGKSCDYELTAQQQPDGDRKDKQEQKQQKVAKDLNNQLNEQIQAKQQKEKNDKILLSSTVSLSKSSELKQVYPKDIRVAKIFAFVLMVFHQLSGINVIVIYGAHLASGVMPNLINQMPLIINGQKIIAGIFGTLLLKKFGRRFLMIRGNCVLSVSLFGLFLGYAIEDPDSKFVQALILTCFIVYVSTFVMTLGPIAWLYIPEIVQPPLVPYTTMTHWALACTVITIFPMIKDYAAILFLFFSLMTGCNAVMCYYLMVETREKKQSTIREQLNGKNQLFNTLVAKLRSKICKSTKQLSNPSS